MERGPGPLPTGWAPWMVNSDHAGARRPEPGCAMAHTILIVEDQLKIRVLLRGYFEREGFAVVTNGSGAEATTLAGSAQPDLNVLDLGPPAVSGEALAASMRPEAPTPLLLLTAQSAAAHPNPRPHPGRQKP